MPELSGLPKTTKYTPGDSVYIVQDFKILNLMISGWRVEVRNPLSDSDGLQVTRYSFIERPELEVIESLVFASENACLAWMKNDYINRAIESGGGGYGLFQSGLNVNGDARSFGNWTDFAGFDMTGAKFVITNEFVLCSGTATTGTPSLGYTPIIGTGTHFLTDFAPGDKFELTGGTIPYGIDATVDTVTDDTHLTVLGDIGVFTDQFVMKEADPYSIAILEESDGEKTLVFDYCNLATHELPDSISDPADSWADFRAGVRSYDAETTIMPDGNPIGRP